MIWFYTRDQQSLTLETRFDNDTLEYVAVVIGGGGQPETVRFATAEAFREWLLHWERDRAAERWTPDSAPYVIRDGWPDKTPRH